MFSLTIEINHNQSQFVTSYILRSQIATSSYLRSQNLTSSSRSQFVILDDLSINHTLK